MSEGDHDGGATPRGGADEAPWTVGRLLTWTTGWLEARGSESPRLDAEVLRDQALAASNLLVQRIGGRPVKPYQPDSIWEDVAMKESTTRFYQRDQGEALYRRSLYTFWKRTVPYPAMTAFDAPAAEQSCVRRNRSNTPLQALVTLNEPTMNNAARWLGWRALQQGGASPESRATFLFRQVLGRRPDPRAATPPDAAAATCARGARGSLQ